MIDGIARGKDDAIVLGQVNAVLSEILTVNPFYMDEAAEIDLQLVLAGQIEVRRLLSSRLGLRNQNGLDLLAHFSLPLPRAEQNRNWEEFEAAKVEKPFHRKVSQSGDPFERPTVAH